MTRSRSLLGSIGRNELTGQVDRWALLIGVSKYAHASLNLKFAGRDAAKLRDTLLEPTAGAFPEDHVVALIDDHATLPNLTKALRTFLKKPGVDDLVILFVACHGSRDRDRPDNLYLLPHDVDPTDISGTGLPMREVDLALRETLHSRRVVVLVDACHSGGLSDSFADLRGVDDAAADLNAYLNALSASREGVSLMTSAMASESSVEGEQWGGGHGVFTYFLLEGLRGRADGPPYDGVVTVGELFDFVGERVREETQGRQHPHISSDADRNLVLSVTGSMSAGQHLELARRLAEAAELLDERTCWRGAAAQYAEFMRFQRDLSADSSSVEHAVALFRSGAADHAVQRLRSLPHDRAGVRLNLGLMLLAQGHPGAHATLLEPTAAETWAPALFSTPVSAGRRVALLVGLDVVDPTSYGWDGKLTSPVAEVDALSALLRDEFGFEEQIRLVNGEATAAAIQRVMSDLTKRSTDCEALVVFLSGHGTVIPAVVPTPDGLESTFLTFDAQITAIEVDRILAASAADRTTLIVSAAHSGGFTERAVTGGYDVLASCGKNQVDFDGPRLSLFMDGLLSSLTPVASGDMVLNATRAYVQSRGHEQSPVFALNGDLPLIVEVRPSGSATVLAKVLLGATATVPAPALDEIVRLGSAGDVPALAASAATLEQWRRRSRGMLQSPAVLATAGLAAACGAACLSARSSPAGMLGAALDRLRAFDVVQSSPEILAEVSALIEEAGATAGVMSRLRAVLIAIAASHGDDAASKDATAGVTALRHALVDKGASPECITTLVDGEATGDAIRAALTSAAEDRSTHAVLIYWCAGGTIDQLNTYDGALSQGEISALAPDATLIAEGIGAGALHSRNGAGEAVPRLVVWKESEATPERLKTVKRSKKAQVSSGNGKSRAPELATPAGRLARAVVDAISRSDAPESLRTMHLAPATPPIAVVNGSSDLLLGDPIVTRVDALSRRVRHLQLSATEVLVCALLDRRNGVDPEAQLQLGVLRAETGDVDGAITAFEKSAQQFDSNRTGDALARLHLGRVLLDSGRDRARAVSECRAAAERDPDLVAAWFWLGRSIAELIQRETTAQASAALRTYLARGAPIGRRSEVTDLLAALSGKPAR